MGTVFRNPHWLVPDNANKTKKANYSLDFDAASNDYIDCGTGLFTGSNIPSISISCWVTAASSGSGLAIVSKDQAITGTRNFLFQLVSDTVYWQTSSNGNNLSQTVVNSSGVTDGNWHHIVVTYEAGATSGTAEKKIYIDGQLRATDSAATIPNIYNTTTVPIEIGRRGDATRYFDGKICQVCVFDYAVQQTDITTLYGDAANGVGDPLSLTTPPVAYYPLGDEMVYNGSNLLVPNMAKPATGSGNFVSLSFDVLESMFLNSRSTDDNEYTISLWVKPTYVSGTDTFIYFDNVNPDICLSFRSSGTSINIQNGTTALYNIGTYTLNTWHHIVLQSDGITLIAYVNGIPNSVFSLSTLTAWDSPKVIDTVSIDANSTMRGEMSQIALYNGSSISPSDLWNNGVQPSLAGNPNLVSLIECNQDSAIYQETIAPYDSVTNEYYGSTLPPENYSLDTPNSNSSGLGYNLSPTDLVNSGPYSTKNIISKNSAGISQLLSIGANQINVTEPEKAQLTVSTTLRNNDPNANEVVLRFRGDTTDITDCTIEWGDGTSTSYYNDTSNLRENVSHTYATPGIYKIRISGDVFFNWGSGGIGGSDPLDLTWNRNLISIDNWGSNVNWALYQSFYSAINNDVKALDTPNFLNNTNFSNPQFCFFGNTKMINANDSISRWDMSSRSTIAYMFYGCNAFNGSVSNWTLPSTLADSSYAFYNCYSFNQPIQDWGISLSNASNMFRFARSFNQNLSNLNFNWSAYIYTNRMLDGATAFNNGGANWTISSAIGGFNGVFTSCPNFEGNGLSAWTFTGNPYLGGIFNNVNGFTEDVTGWTIAPSFIGTAFSNANASVLDVDFSGWDLSNVTSFSSTFSSANLPNIILDTNTSSLQVMSSAFFGSTMGNQSWIANLDTSGVTVFDRCFQSSNINLDLGDYDISSATNMFNFFRIASSMSTSNITSTLTKFAIKVYNGDGNTGVNANNFANPNTFDNSQTSDTGGTAFPWPAGSGWSNAGDALDWLASSTGGNWTGVTNGLTRIN